MNTPTPPHHPGHLAFSKRRISDWFPKDFYMFSFVWMEYIVRICLNGLRHAFLFFLIFLQSSCVRCRNGDDCKAVKLLLLLLSGPPETLFQWLLASSHLPSLTLDRERVVKSLSSEQHTHFRRYRADRNVYTEAHLIHGSQTIDASSVHSLEPHWRSSGRQDCEKRTRRELAILREIKFKSPLIQNLNSLNTYLLP